MYLYTVLYKSEEIWKKKCQGLNGREDVTLVSDPLLLSFTDFSVFNSILSTLQP